jgi:trimethylamine:corrinoid methyltransferase-like protein
MSLSKAFNRQLKLTDRNYGDKIMNKFAKTTKALVLVGIALGLTACKSNNSVANTAQYMTTSYCSSVEAVTLTSGVEQAKANLSGGACNYKFADYYEQLVDVAKGEPGMSNKRVFNDFLKWANQSQLISKKDAAVYFNNYFGKRFMSLNDTYNVCSLADKQTSIFNELERELAQKRKGMLDALGDKIGFSRVAKQKADLVTVLEATWMACDNA